MVVLVLAPVLVVGVARPLHFPLLTAIVIVYFSRLCLRLPSSLSHSLLCDPVLYSVVLSFS